MNETSDDALNLLLAEHFEKKPVCKPRLPDNWEFPNPAPDQRTSKYWQFIYQGTKEFPNKWQPRSFITDPAMRDLLQQKLLEEGCKVTIRKLSGDIMILNIETATFLSYEIKATRERLWPEAFARAKGLIG